jgi:hypothetical protein
VLKYFNVRVQASDNLMTVAIRANIATLNAGVSAKLRDRFMDEVIAAQVRGGDVAVRDVIVDWVVLT